MSNLAWAKNHLATIESSKKNHITLILDKYKAIELFRYYIFQLSEFEKGIRNG